MASRPPEQPICCPRCGYDLRGSTPPMVDEVASFISRAEAGESEAVEQRLREIRHLQHNCPECGLTFRWRDLVDPAHHHPLWCVESRDGALLKQIPLTFLCSLLPWRFWSRLRMEHRPRWRRIGLYALLVLPVCYIAFAINHGLFLKEHAATLNAPPNLAGVNEFEAFWRGALTPFSGRLFGTPTRPIIGAPREYLGIWAHRPVAAWTVFMSAFLITAPLAFIALPISRKRAKVRWSHIWRIAVYSLPLLAPGFILACSISRGLPMLIFRFGSVRLILLWLAWLGTCALLMVWWGCATRRYLRMEQPIAVAMSVALIATIASLVAMYLVVPNLTHRLFMSIWQALMS